jgi:hypothetical protein
MKIFGEETIGWIDDGSVPSPQLLFRTHHRVSLWPSSLPEKIIILPLKNLQKKASRLGPKQESSASLANLMDQRYLRLVWVPDALWDYLIHL